MRGRAGQPVRALPGPPPGRARRELPHSPPGRSILQASPNRGSALPASPEPTADRQKGPGPMAAKLEVTVISADDHTVRARARGEADLDSSWPLRDTLEPLLFPGATLILEADRLEFIDSWAINDLIQLALAARALGGCVRFANPTAAVERALEVSGLDRLLGVHRETGDRLDDAAPA